MSALGALTTGNLFHRPLRTLITLIAIGAEVCLVVVIVGLTTGILQETAKRIEGVGADLMLQPPASNFLLAFSGAPMPIAIGDKLEEIDHVAAVAPVLLQFNTSGGLDTVYGIDLESFNRVSYGFVYHAGGPFEQPSDILIDDWYATAQNLKVGDTLTLFENEFTVRAIVEHGKGARLFVPIEKLQELSASPDKASLFFIRVENPGYIPQVEQEILKIFPRYQLRPVREFYTMMTSADLPGLELFVNSMITVGVVVGFLVIFLAMYTTVLERTREIGILKSLGASRLSIIRLVVREALLLAIVGAALGVGFSYGGAALLKNIFPTLTVLVQPEWLLRASLLALVSGLLGAAYPAWLAARQDAIVALAYE